MESRKILIVDSSTNSKVTVETDATTFGELKEAVKAAGVNYNGKDWLEGLTKTTPMSDDALLPINVPYKGQVTNNLVYMLSNTNKQIKSGVELEALSRNEILGIVKGTEGMKEMLKEKYGKPYTNIKTDVLIEELNALVCNEEECPYMEAYETLVDAVANLVVTVGPTIWKDIQDRANEVISHLENIADAEPREINFSQEELDEMFD